MFGVGCHQSFSLRVVSSGARIAASASRGVVAGGPEFHCGLVPFFDRTMAELPPVGDIEYGGEGLFGEVEAAQQFGDDLR